MTQARTHYLVAAILAVAFATVVGATPAPAAAHGSLDVVDTDEYRFEFGTEPSGTLTAGESASLLVAVEDLENYEAVGDLPLWIRIAGPEGIVFASENFVSNTEQLVTIAFRPGTAGEYTLRIQPLDRSGETTYSAGTFDFTVEANDEEATTGTCFVGETDDKTGSVGENSIKDFFSGYLFLELFLVVMAALGLYIFYKDREFVRNKKK